MTQTPCIKITPNLPLMKTLRFLLPLLVILPTLRAAVPRFYVTGQIGAFAADAGTPAANGGHYIDRGIKSGTKAFSDWSVGAELLDWLSLEAGYVDFSSFASAVFVLRPDVMTVRAEAVWRTYDLRGFRLTPVFKVFSTNRVTLRFLGGLTFATGRVITRDRTLPGYEWPVDLANASYHLGMGAACNLTKQATLEARILRYDFGKPERDPNRITAMTYSLGLSWHF